MNSKNLLLASAISVMAATAGSSMTLDFDDLTPASGGIDISGGFDYEGYTFSGDHPSFIWEGTSPNANGTNNLIAGYDAVVTITKTGGGTFDFLSADMVISFYDPSLTETIFVNGVAYDLTTSLTTFNFNLTNVSSVTITSLDQGYWSADNLVFGATAAVPLPASAVLLAVGAAGLFGMRRRKSA
jgi:hypothetical protein